MLSVDSQIPATDLVAETRAAPPAALRRVAERTRSSPRSSVCRPSAHSRRHLCVCGGWHRSWSERESPRPSHLLRRMKSPHWRAFGIYSRAACRFEVSSGWNRGGGTIDCPGGKPTCSRSKMPPVQSSESRPGISCTRRSRVEWYSSSGSGEACSEYLTVLTRPGSEREIAAALSQWLSTDGAGDWDLLHLAAVLESDPAASALAQEFARREHLIHQQPGMPCWQCELPATWDEFLRQLSKSRRERVRQLTRKYFDTGRVQTRWVSTEAELDRLSRCSSTCISAAAKAWDSRAVMRRSDSPRFIAKSVAACGPRASYVCCGPKWTAGPSAPNTTSLTVEPFITIRRAWSRMRSRTIPVGWR